MTNAKMPLFNEIYFIFQQTTYKWPKTLPKDNLTQDSSKIIYAYDMGM